MEAAAAAAAVAAAGQVQSVADAHIEFSVAPTTAAVASVDSHADVAAAPWHRPLPGPACVGNPWSTPDGPGQRHREVVVRRVLLVDDESVLRRLLSRMLERLGVAHTALEDGREVEGALTREHPDLILLDIVMKHSDGVQVRALGCLCVFVCVCV